MFGKDYWKSKYKQDGTPYLLKNRSIKFAWNLHLYSNLNYLERNIPLWIINLKKMTIEQKKYNQ